MKNSMSQMTLQDLVGKWISHDGKCSFWVYEKDKIIQIFKDHNLAIQESLNFYYNESENVCIVSDSVVLWMIQPRDESIILKIAGDCVEFFPANKYVL